MGFSVYGEEEEGTMTDGDWRWSSVIYDDGGDYGNDDAYSDDDADNSDED